MKTFVAATVCWAAASIAALQAGTISDGLKEGLFSYQNDALQPFDINKLAGIKVFAFYYSAHWCGPCRAFTPELVKFYNREKKDHPEFEIVFLSHDRSRDAMIEYMRELKMPWPATEFGKGAAIRKYSSRGIPCLVVVDENGTVLADSFDGEKYLGAKKAMDDLGKILAKAKGSSSTQSAAKFDDFFKKKDAR